MPLTIYKSSAGSGKTYTLVREYIKLLIINPFDYRSILAITFTNKATDEMKKRIIKNLSQLATGTFDALANQIVYDLGGLLFKRVQQNEQIEKPTQADLHVYLRSQAQKALDVILHDYSQFSISTIDSFFQKIMRFFIQEVKCKEIQIPTRYEVEMDTGLVLQQIIGNLLVDIGGKDHKELTSWLEEFAFRQIEQQKGWNIANQITDLGGEIFKERYHSLQQGKEKMPYDALKKLIKQLWQIKLDFEEQLSSFSKEALELIEGYGATIKAFKSGTASFFTNIVDDSKANRFVLSATQQKIYDTNNPTAWVVKKKSAEQEKALQAAQNGLHDIFMETVSFIENNIKEYNSATAVLKNIYVYGILNDLTEKIRDYRSENSLMLISDTNNILHEIISREELPFVYEKMGTAFKHVLIDEFQDTSDFQWKNLLPLVMNALGSGAKALVVGDVKQSIYRWRGGNMQLLLQGVQQHTGAFFDPKETEKNLEANYRSRENIVAFNNAFFKTAVKLLSETLAVPNIAQLSKAYQSVVQEVKHKGGGYVQIRFIKPPSRAIKWQEIAEQHMLQSIEELQEVGYDLRDIAILVRTNGEGSKVAQILAQNNIKVVSSESLLLKNSAKVRLLISVLKYLSDRRDKIAKTEILTHYLRIYPLSTLIEKLSAQQLKVVADLTLAGQLDAPDFHQIYTDHLQEEADNLFNKILPELFIKKINQLATKPLYELVEMLLQYFDLCQNADAYVQRFQDLMLEFNTVKSPDIALFLDWWKDNKDKDKTSIIIPAGENAVTIMTIHKAKGLEFPIVLMPYCEWKFNPKPGSTLWVDSTQKPYNQMGAIPLKINKQLKDSHFAADYQKEVLQTFIDNLNVLYVAFTRPVQRLYLFTKAPPKKASENISATKLLSSVLNNEDFDFTEKWNTETLVFELGSAKVKYPTHDKSGIRLENITHYISNDYQDKITIRSDSDRFFMLFDNEQSEAIKMGQQIHSILEKMERPSDLDTVIRKLQIQGVITADVIEQIKSRISKIFTHPKVKNWFSDKWEVIAERQILYNQRIYIPDRVMINEQNQAIVVDYKTGAFEEKKNKRYRRQIQRYADILSQMGYTVMEKNILYISETGIKLVKIGDR